jgi:hypothetical protein
VLYLPGRAGTALVPSRACAADYPAYRLHLCDHWRDALVEGVQAWVAVVAATLTTLVGIFKYFNYKSKRDRQADVGTSFASIVDALSSDNSTRRMAAAVLLRRFFDPRTEQGSAGVPYEKEAIEVIAGLLREDQPEQLQKALADGLRFARDIRGADLQRCNLTNAFLGTKMSDRRQLDMSGADLFEADCSGASLRGVTAVGTVFYRATLEGTVFIDANLQNANFREGTLTRAKFAGAKIGGASFAGATDVPSDVTQLLGEDDVATPGAVVPKPEH